MSDTPRTDARVRRMIDNNIGPEALEYFARDLERELNEANERIKRLEEKVKDMESARTQAAANSLANMLAYEDATKKIAVLIKEGDKTKRDAARYEVVRKMNPTDFALMYQRCMHMDLRFDDEVDRLAATRTVKMHLKVKEDER